MAKKPKQRRSLEPPPSLRYDTRMPSQNIAAAKGRIPDKAVHHQLNRILASKTFRQVDRLKRFVSFIVQEAVAKRGEVYGPIATLNGCGK